MSPSAEPITLSASPTSIVSSERVKRRAPMRVCRGMMVDRPAPATVTGPCTMRRAAARARRASASPTAGATGAVGTATRRGSLRRAFSKRSVRTRRPSRAATSTRLPSWTRTAALRGGTVRRSCTRSTTEASGAGATRYDNGMSRSAPKPSSRMMRCPTDGCFIARATASLARGVGASSAIGTLMGNPSSPPDSTTTSPVASAARVATARSAWSGVMPPTGTPAMDTPGGTRSDGAPATLAATVPSTASSSTTEATTSASDAG